MNKLALYNCRCGYNGYDLVHGKWTQQCSNCGELQKRYTLRYNNKETQHETVNIAYKENPRYSVALGVSETQIEEARKLHPQAEWKKFGNSYRPLIKNRAEKLKLMKQAGMEEYEPSAFRDKNGNG